MDATPEEDAVARRAREALGRLLRPRGELITEKRAMTQELAQSLGQESLDGPIFLFDPDTRISLSKVPSGKQKEFIEAVHKNLQLQTELSKLRAGHKASASAAIPAFPSTKADAEKKLLEEQLECNRLEKERQRLEALNRYYEELDHQPAAAPDFLNPTAMFRNCALFPELPRELVEGFTKDQEVPDQEAEELVSRLRKATLRQKLVLEHDQRTLEGLKAKHPINLKSLPPEIQITALNAVKNSLVNWIETMLSKAGEGESEETTGGGGGGGGSSPSKNGTKDFDRNAQLADIEKEYKRHIELRKQIMASMSQLRKLRDAPQQSKEELALNRRLPSSSIQASIIAPPPPPPQTYLLTPYLEKLQALSREQKGFVQEKAHINATIARQRQETSKALRRLAQDGKLLSQPQPQSQPTTTTTTNDNTTINPPTSFAKATQSASIASQVQPWLFAADTAKIATLEAVASAVDRGQASADDAVRALHHVSLLRNKGPLRLPGDHDHDHEEEENAGAGVVEEEECSGEDEKSGGGEKNKKKDKDKKSGKEERGSIWSVLDGNLGLINQ